MWCSCEAQLGRRTSVVYSAKASALALITVSITHSMPALQCMTQQPHACWRLHAVATSSSRAPMAYAKLCFRCSTPASVSRTASEVGLCEQDAPAGEQLQQLHEEASHSAPLGGRLDLQLPAVQHRALACSAANAGRSHTHKVPCTARETCWFGTHFAHND